MTNNKKPDITNDVLIADIMLRIAAIEKIIIEKGVCTQDELTAATEEIAKRVAKVVLEKAQAAKKIEELTASLEGAPKKEPAN